MRIQTLAKALPLVALAAGCAAGPQRSAEADASTGKAVMRLVGEAAGVQSQSLATSRWSAQLVAAAPRLPRVGTRRLYHSADGTRYYAEDELRSLPDTARANFIPETVDEEAYYYGPLGSPLFYVRLIDIVSADLRTHLPGRRILEWNYSSIGPLVLLAAQGAQVVGISPSPRLRALYSAPGDQGDIKVADREVSGRLTVNVGRFPADPSSASAMGGNYDVIIARNVLTRGYIHPSAPTGVVGPAIDLGVSDEIFLTAMLGALKPGGRLLVYNLCTAPPPADRLYDPHSDCRNPFPQSLWQAMGFRVRDYDRSDTAAARALLKALGAGALTTPTLPSSAGTARLVPDELYATYTLVEKP